MRWSITNPEDSAMRSATYSLVFGIGAALRCTPIGPVSGDDVALTGNWGAAHAALTITDSGGTIEYACAHGGFRSAAHADQVGNFDVLGVHVPGHGGPVREGEIPDSLPARYIGHVSGSRMTLRVLVRTDTLGPFELVRGGQAQLFRCL